MVALTDAALLILAEVVEEKLGKGSQGRETWSLQFRGGVGWKESRGHGKASGTSQFIIQG